jgi:hypothetical protein
MSSKRIPGRSSLRSNKGILKVKNSYLRIPYCLLKSEDFLDLSPLATKVFLTMLKDWKTHKPDDPVEVSFDKLQKITHAGRSRISQAIKQLITFGFVHKVNQYKQCNLYYIEQKRFTGEKTIHS